MKKLPQSFAMRWKLRDGNMWRIGQIKDRVYTEPFAGYKGRLLLVGINYDRKTKKHECIIEEITK